MYMCLIGCQWNGLCVGWKVKARLCTIIPLVSQSSLLTKATNRLLCVLYPVMHSISYASQDTKHKVACPWCITLAMHHGYECLSWCQNVCNASKQVLRPEAQSTIKMFRTNLHVIHYLVCRVNERSKYNRFFSPFFSRKYGKKRLR